MMHMAEQIRIISDTAGIRLDAFLADETEYSRSRIQKLIETGNVITNGKLVKASYTVQDGDCITIHVPEVMDLSVQPENIPLDIIYDDESLCVVNKPQGMVVHPAPGHESGTLVNALMYHIKDLSSVGGVKRPGIVHRIDKMTSGLLVIAKNDSVHQALSEQFRSHSAGRQYICLVDGNIKDDLGTVDQPIGRSLKDRKKMAVVSDGRNAVTHWEVLERFKTNTLLRVRLETGRTHQIRVHMAYIHHPVTGDDVYGQNKKQLGLEGQALHGYHLHFEHPVTGRKMVFETPVPDYFIDALRKLGWSGSATEYETDGQL